MGQPSFHHHARPLTHQPLQWCYSWHLFFCFIYIYVYICMFVCPHLFVPLSMAMPSIQRLFMSMFLVKSNGWNSTMHALQNRDRFESLFLKPILLSIICSSIHPSIYPFIAFIHAFISPSIVIAPSIHGCSRESIPASEKTQSQSWTVFSSLKLQSLT